MNDYLFQYILNYINEQDKATTPYVGLSENLLKITTKDVVYRINPDTLECEDSTNPDITYVMTEEDVIALLRHKEEQYVPPLNIIEPPIVHPPNKVEERKDDIKDTTANSIYSSVFK